MDIIPKPIQTPLLEKSVNRVHLSIKQALEKPQEPIPNTFFSIEPLKKDINQRQVTDTWQLFLASLTDGQAKIALQTITLEHSDDHHLFVKCTSRAVQDEFNNHRFEIHKFLCEKLENSMLELDTQIIEIAKNESNVLYTPEEKYRYLTDKNPNLEVLRTKLGLDLYE